jgi:hypothetical protein
MRSMLFRPAIIFSSLLVLLSSFTVGPSSADTTVGGSISTDTTWTLSGSPYIVTSAVTVMGTDGDDGITTLTIQPGVIVKFNRYINMDIGATSGDPVR